MPSSYVSQVQPSKGTPFDNTSNGFTSTNAQAAIEEARNNLQSAEANASSPTTTTSGTFVPISSMSVVVPATGTWLVMFAGAMYNTGANATGEYAVFLDEVQSHTRGLTCNVEILGLITLNSNNFRTPACFVGRVVATAGQTITARFRRTSAIGSIGIEQRTLQLIRIS